MENYMHGNLLESKVFVMGACLGEYASSKELNTIITRAIIAQSVRLILLCAHQN